MVLRGGVFGKRVVFVNMVLFNLYLEDLAKNSVASYDTLNRYVDIVLILGISGKWNGILSSWLATACLLKK